MTHASTNAQVDLYGATWATRFQALRSAYGLSQRSLAATVGLSAPMVSQLVSGQRVKISNPSVLARIVRLEECLSDPEVVAGDQGAIAAVLESVVSSTPVLRTTSTPTESERDAAVRWLATNTENADLEALAALAHSRGSEAVAAALNDAAHLDPARSRWT
ncbi:MAG: helix-turn-helix transcriptional regulator [Ancrocorticia sp.]